MNISELVVRNEVFDDKSKTGLWESIVMDERAKRRLLRAAVLSQSLRPVLPFTVTALHGLAILSGPPGTGKTTLARALAEKMVPFLSGRKARFIEVNPHGLMSAEHGQSQQRVTELLTDRIPDLASDGTPTVVLLDEVESMAIARSETSLSANPADVHRATDAVLTSLDRNADSHPHIYFVATTNFPDGLDAAFLSRADLHVEMPLPDQQGVRNILGATLRDFGTEFAPLTNLADSDELDKVARRMVGLDGRAVRKSVTEAMLNRQETTVDPSQLTIEDLLAVAGAS